MSAIPNDSYAELTQALGAAVRRHVPHVLAAYLFGSYARRDARADSDLDVAVLCKGPLSPTERFEVALSLGAELDRDVDLIDLRTASTVLRSQAVARGIRLFGSGLPEVVAFEDFVYSDYARLNEERAEILEDVSTRGSIRDR